MKTFLQFLREDVNQKKSYEEFFELVKNSLSDFEENEEVFSDRISDYYDMYDRSFDKTSFKVYRAIRLDDISELNIKKLGVFWSFYIKGAEPQNGTGNKTFVIRANVSPKDVDWFSGCYSFCYYGEEQWECYVEPNTNIVIDKIFQKENRELIDLNIKTNIIGNIGKSYAIWTDK